MLCTPEMIDERTWRSSPRFELRTGSRVFSLQRNEMEVFQILILGLRFEAQDWILCCRIDHVERLELVAGLR